MPRKMIEVEHLIKRYKRAKVNAVDDISFDGYKGEFFALLGPNGAGKTTTISVLTTTLSKTSGVVKIAKYDIDKDSSLVRKNIGVIFQNPSLDKNLTAEENIRFHCILYGLYPYRPTYSLMSTKYKIQLKKLSKIIGLENDIHAKVDSFSGGMKRKLEIIRSLMHKPKVLYLDEPTSGLDPQSRRNLWEYLSSVRKSQKTTMFLTTHYLEEAEQADRVAIINKGKLVTLGTPHQIKKDLIKKYLILNATNRNSLMKELKKMRVKYHENEMVHVEVNGKSAQEIVQQIKTPLSFLDIHNPTLEDAYLKIISKNGRN